MEFLTRLFDTSDFPARWRCGNWTASHGWLHILSDIAVWAAYFAIPLVLIYFVARRRDLPFRRVFLLFVVFILLCGTTHLMEAIIFWWPAYRLAGVLKLLTAVVSWVTVLALVRVAPVALTMRTAEELQREVAARREAERKLAEANAILEGRVEERTAALGRAVEAEAEQRERLRITLASIGDAVISTDRDGSVTYLNAVAESLTGWTHADATGRPLTEVFNIVNESTREPVENPAMRALSEGVIVGLANHTVLIGRDGTERPIDDSAAPIRNKDGEVVGGVLVFRDLGEKRKLEREREEAQQRIATTLESVTDGFMRYDRDWRIVYVNAEAERINRLTRSDMLGRNVWEVFPDLVGTHFEAEFRRGVAAQVTIEFENYYKPFGRWYSLKGYPTPDGGLTTFIRDITEQKNHQDALAESEARYRAIGESIDYGVWACDAQGRNTYASESFLRMVGITQQQCSDFGWGDVLHPEDAEATIAAWQGCVQAQGTWDRVHRFKGADGLWHHVLARGVPLRDATGQNRGWVGINLDITRMVETEREVTRLAAESERQRRLYETVLSNTPDFVYVFSLDHKVVYANDSLIKMWGRGHEGAIGKTFLEIGYEPWHADMHDREIDQVRATRQPIRGEVPFHGTNGRREYDYIFVPVLGADGEVEAVAGTTRDVTERKEAEERLRRSHDTFFALIQNNPFGVYVVDADFLLRQISLGAQKVFGTVRPLLDRNFEEVLRILWPDPFATETINRFRHTLDTGEPYNSPSTIERRADLGEVEAYDWRIERIGMPDGRYGVVCYFYDLSERQSWEETLRASEQRLRLATNAAALGIWTWRPDGDEVAWENNRPYEIFALPRTDAPLTAARFVEEFLHPADVEVFETAFSTAVRDGTPLSCECRIRRTDGELRWIEFTGHTVAGEQDGRMIGTVQDITNRRIAEEELRKLAADLSEAARRKDEFLATLAHELRNPLAPIRNGLQVIRMADANETIEQARAMMERQLGQMVRLVDDLLDVSRVTTGKLTLSMDRVELRTVIEAALETCRPVIDQAGHHLDVVIPDEPILVNADLTRLAQVVLNLLTNSAKYTHRGGHIRLTASHADGMAVLSVRDDGIGIPPAMLERVFEMFTQVDRRLEKTTGGLGIGLSLVKGLVQMHGGTIGARSEGEGRGSEFIVTLPVLKRADQRLETRTAKPEASLRTVRRRVLVVDDNIDAATSLAKLLSLLGHDVRTAHDGEAGLSAAESFRPEVVLMDIGMPKLNGYEACRCIRGQPWGQGMVLVALTGWGQEDDRQKSADAGFNHHLVKPVELAAVSELLAALPARSP